ncbi:hypothetical protein H5410_005518 [Solanum commersonii]|uniref:Uncharacterized protein n=1 Tax=Solanum commersonii TaxID=4109 RepID=A0A9J6A7S6_SOLCO|nr:hypothetical protein H5410_005518 [Solanum commersonii]
MDYTINTVASSEIPTSSIANLPPDARQKGPMPPYFPTSSELNQGDHFTTFQQTQGASLTHSTQDTPLVYTFAPLKAPMVTHHSLPVYTYVSAPPVTKAQDFHHQNLSTLGLEIGATFEIVQSLQKLRST